MSATNTADLSGFATPLAIAVRAHLRQLNGDGGNRRRHKRELEPIEPSDHVLVIDTETTTDPAQSLRFGFYQLRKDTDLDEAGFFFDPEGLTESELILLRSYATTHDFKVMTVAEFVENVLFGIAYELGAIIVGLNLPFDLSRLAIGHGPARTKSMRGGFTFKLSRDPRRPHVQIKHLTRTASLIQFATPARREFRNSGQRISPSRGYFVDARTLAAALTNRSFTLGGLADFLETPHRKLDTDEHGGPLTENYLKYAANDVQVTWECFAELRQRYERLGLTKTPINKVLSVASVGKAAFRQMGIRSWREQQSDFPRELLGIIMSTYFGGRSEVHLRRVITPVVYSDFLSMYPTVCTLMKLWRFVIAKKMTWRDATSEVRSFLERVTRNHLRQPAAWPNLCAIVQVDVDGDIFPVRAEYGHESHYSTGTNCPRGEILWYTLPDCIASKLRTGKSPKVLKAIVFEPGEIQDGLAPIEVPVAIPGHAPYRIDPARDDFYHRGIDLRNEVKAQLKIASAAEADALDTLQQFLKILINATSYGIFLELNVEDLVHPEDMRCYGPAGKAFRVRLKQFEEPGSYFHPLLGTLITGAARLMLTLAELLTLEAGLDWAFCDTDSLAIAKPDTIDWCEFEYRVRKIQAWFSPLNPYASKEPLLKIEDVNYRIGGKSGHIHPLYCFAVSAKRYALFNQESAP